jgi:negative regulator of sigma-B (phosphoserine phosphatase)
VKLAAEFLTLPRDGEAESGDVALVRREEETTLLAVVDALGHGARAATAAGIAAAYLGDAPLERGIVSLVEGLHERLRGTRGAAAMILLVARGRLEGCGVGNVEARGVGTRVPTVLTPGVLGAQMTRLKVFDAELSARGRIVVFSDGISSRVGLDDVAALGAADACRALMDRYRRPADDATVLVTDFEAFT